MDDRDQYVLFHAPRYHCEILTADAVLCARDPQRAPIPPDQAALAALGRAAALWDRRSLIPAPPSGAPAEVSVRPASGGTDQRIATPIDERADAQYRAESATQALHQQGARAGYVVYASRALRAALLARAKEDGMAPSVAAAAHELSLALEPYDQPISDPHELDDAQRVAAALAEQSAIADRLAARAARAEALLRRLAECVRAGLSLGDGFLDSALGEAADLLAPPAPVHSCDPARQGPEASP